MLKKIFFAESLYLWLAFSSLIIAQLFVFFGPVFNFILLKDFAIVATFAIAIVISSKKVITPFLSLLPVVIYVLISALFSHANSFAKLAAMRQMFMPYLLIFIGYLLTSSRSDYKQLLRLVVIVLKVILFLGLIELLIHAWEFIDIRTYYQIKKMWVNPTGYPSMFIEPILGGVKRMASTFLDPINLGHAFVFLFYVLYENRGRKFWIALSLIGVLLTISKGAILQLLIVFWIINRRQKIFNKVSIFFTLLILIIIAYNYHGGLVKHVSGITNAIKSISIFGHGLAMVGNQSHMFASELSDSSGIGDTFIGSILGQLGFLGFVLWVFPLYYFSTFFSKNSILKRLFLAQLLVSILSENAFNLLSVLSVALIFGSAFYINYNLEKKSL